MGLVGCAGTAVEVRPVATTASAQLSKEDRQLIETLLERLKGKDMKFVREGVMYDAKMAAWYMKLKWQTNSDKVKSLEDFVALESTGGEHGEIKYYVEFPDGSRKEAREVLEASVKKLRAGSMGRSSITWSFRMGAGNST